MTTPPQGPQLGECRSCGATIRWAHTTKGHRIPLDPDPVGSPAGNLIFDSSFTRRPTVRALTPQDLAARPLVYRSHFVTCPHAAQHRHKARAITRQGAEA